MKRSPFAAGTAAAALAAAWMYAVPASAETGVTDDTIKIGALGVLTGPNAKFGDTVYNGVEAVYKEANDGGRDPRPHDRVRARGRPLPGG